MTDDLGKRISDLEEGVKGLTNEVKKTRNSNSKAVGERLDTFTMEIFRRLDGSLDKINGRIDHLWWAFVVMLLALSGALLAAILGSS